MIQRVGIKQRLGLEELIEVVADFKHRHDFPHGGIGDRAPAPQRLQHGSHVVGDKRLLAFGFQLHLSQQPPARLVVHQNLGNMMGQGGLFHQISIGFGKPDRRPPVRSTRLPPADNARELPHCRALR